MFCPFCNKQNQEYGSFCEFCGKALPQKSSAAEAIQPVARVNLISQKASIPKARLSYDAKRGIVTDLLIVIIGIIVIVIYYPSVFPWKW
jgi:uncharacterized membrane protein YvbJ